MSTLKHRRDIDGLRTLAVIPVVLNHAGVPGFPGGFIGVDIFFVISGYLITGILARDIELGRFSIARFYERRARRILPALFALLTVCFVGGILFLLPHELANLAKSSLAAIFFVSNIEFWRTAGDYFADGVLTEPLLHTWSLAVEEQFYLFFPILLWLLARRSKVMLRGGVALLCFLSFAASLWATAWMPTANFYLIPFRLWELALGALLALGLVDTPGPRISRTLASAVGLASIAASIVLIDETTPFPGAAALPACLGTVLLIWAGSAENHLPWANRILSWSPFVAIGLISYSLYLWHWPILVAARIYTAGQDLSAPMIVVCVALAFVLAWLSWRFVEQPFRVGNGGPQFTQRKIFAMSGIGMALLGASAFVVLGADGLPARLPKTVAAAYHAAVERSDREQSCVNRAPEQEPCRLGVADPRAVDFVLWGDSHAGAIIPGVDAYLREKGLAGVAFAKTGCAPLVGITRLDEKAGKGCDTFNDKVLARIVDQFPGSTVALVGRWTLMVEGTRPRGEDGPPPVLAFAGGERVAPDRYPAVVEGALRSTVAALVAAGHPVVIFKGNPELGFSGPAALARQGWLGWTAPVIQAADFQRRNARADRVVDAVASAEGAMIADPSADLCQATCRYAIAGRSLYKDDDHLSDFGANFLIPRALERVEADSSGRGFSQENAVTGAF